jgi:hypothetical protein
MAYWHPTPAARARTTKPAIGTAEVDWTHRLAKGLVSAWLMNEGGGQLYDLVKPSRIATASTGGWTVSYPFGLTTIGQYLAGTQTDLQFTSEMSISAGMALYSDNYSEVVKCRTYYTLDGDCGGYALGFAPTTDPAGAGIYFMHRNNNQTGAGTATGAAFTVLTGRTLGQMYRVTGTINFGTPQAKLYVDGKLQTTNGSAGTAVNYTSGNGFQPTGAHATDGRCTYAYVHSRVLTDDEAFWLAAEPFAFVRQQTSRSMALMTFPPYLLVKN